MDDRFQSMAALLVTTIVVLGAAGARAQPEAHAVRLVVKDRDSNKSIPIGTGIFARFRDRHLLITAYHDVRNKEGIVVEHFGAAKASSTVPLRDLVEDAFTVDRAADACIFRLKEHDEKRAPLLEGLGKKPIALTDLSAEVGRTVIVVGNPKELTMATGLVQEVGRAGALLGDAVSGDARETWILAIAPDGGDPIEEGFGGGPVVRAFAEGIEGLKLVGIILGQEPPKSSRVFAVDARALARPAGAEPNNHLSHPDWPEPLFAETAYLAPTRPDAGRALPDALRDDIDPVLLAEIEAVAASGRPEAGPIKLDVPERLRALYDELLKKAARIPSEEYLLRLLAEVLRLRGAIPPADPSEE